ncbi:MAG TPA: hypothetical protein VGG10_10190 [Rhizomicrobium sp.]|jgi:hypothetical protein
MSRPVTAVVTGFTKNRELVMLSLAPLQALKQKGVIKRILAVTWDTPEIDPFVAPFETLDGVELIRVPQPEVTGGRYQTGVVYQLRNMEAALQRVPEPDALVVKIRPDFVADVALLEDKIVNFERHCAPSKLDRKFGVKMPTSPFAMKIWIPWADANAPFFYEDAAFIGLKRDVILLADREAENHLGILAEKQYGWFAHIIRFVMPFLGSYPIFERYIREFRYFPNDMNYRLAMIAGLSSDPFFWHLLVVHAWILATSFHVDSGEPGQIRLYANLSNTNADWSQLDSLTVNPPYNNVAGWRAGQKPGGMQPCVTRAYGRLVDDTWQRALFTAPALRDVKPDHLRGILRNVGLYRRGVLAGMEADFYRRLPGIYQKHWEKQAA